VPVQLLTKLFARSGCRDVGHDDLKKDGLVIWGFIFRLIGKSLLETQCDLFLNIHKQSGIKEL
jgi:hypothetical protein